MSEWVALPPEETPTEHVPAILRWSEIGHFYSYNIDPMILVIKVDQRILEINLTMNKTNRRVW